jgi:hypothetical protein
MSASRKPRGDAKLKTLSEDLQDEIFKRLESGTHAAARKWLQEEMLIATSLGALSEFYSWYALRKQLQETDREVNDILELVKSGGYNLDTKQVEAVGNALFLTAARKTNDFKSYKQALELILKTRKVSVEERKVAVLEAKAKAYDQIQQATKGKPSAELTPEERQLVLQVMDESLGITQRQ